MYDDLDKTQGAQTGVMERILDWCEKQGSNLRVEAGQLRFVSHEQATELQALLDELTAAEKATAVAIDAAAQMQTRAESKNSQNLLQAAEYLKK